MKKLIATLLLFSSLGLTNIAAAESSTKKSCPRPGQSGIPINGEFFDAQLNDSHVQCSYWIPNENTTELLWIEEVAAPLDGNWKPLSNGSHQCTPIRENVETCTFIIKTDDQ